MATAGNLPDDVDETCEGESSAAKEKVKYACPHLASPYQSDQGVGDSSAPAVSRRNHLDHTRYEDTQLSIEERGLPKSDINGQIGTTCLSDFNSQINTSSQSNGMSGPVRHHRGGEEFYSIDNHPVSNDHQAKKQNNQNDYEPKKLEHDLYPELITRSILPRTYITKSPRDVCKSTQGTTASPASSSQPNADIQGCQPHHVPKDIDPLVAPQQLPVSPQRDIDRFPRTLNAINLENDLDHSLMRCLKMCEERRFIKDSVTDPVTELRRYQRGQDLSIHNRVPPPERYRLPHNAHAGFPHNSPAAFSIAPMAPQAPMSQICPSQIPSLVPPPSYDECMKLPTSRPLTSQPLTSQPLTSHQLMAARQSGQGEGEVIGRQPPAYRTTVPICFRPSPVFCSDYYTRFIDDSTTIDRWQRRAVGQERVKRLGAYCPCVQRVGTGSNDHMMLSLLACLMCWPIGLGSVYYSYMCRRYKRMGNYAKSASYANSALATGMTGVLLGLISFFTVYIHRRRSF